MPYLQEFKAPRAAATERGICRWETPGFMQFPRDPKRVAVSQQARALKPLVSQLPFQRPPPYSDGRGAGHSVAHGAVAAALRRCADEGTAIEALLPRREVVPRGTAVRPYGYRRDKYSRARAVAERCRAIRAVFRSASRVVIAKFTSTI